MIDTETARLVVMVLLGLSIVWVIAMIIKNDTASLVRALLVMAALGLVFFYLGQTKIETISLKTVKEDLFPRQKEFFSWTRTESSAGGRYQTRFAFAEPGPRLILELEQGGKYLTIKNIVPLNAVLKEIGLPPVENGVRELVAITGSLIDANLYRWNDYKLGILTVERGICRNINTAESYPCITLITVEYR